MLLENSLIGVNIFCIIPILRQENNQTVQKMALAFSTSFIVGIFEGSQAWLESTPPCYEHRSDCLSEEGHWAEWELSWDCHKSLKLKKGKTILSPLFNFNGCKPEWRVIQIWWPRGSRLEGWGSYSERSTKTQRGQEAETPQVFTGELEETKPAISMAWNYLGWHLGQIDPILCVCVCVHIWCMCVWRCITMMWAFFPLNLNTLISTPTHSLLTM